MNNNVPLLAAAGDVLPILFVVIAIISGIVNYVKEQKARAATNEDAKRRQDRQRNRDDQPVYKEIDEFLNELSTDTPVADTRDKPRRTEESARLQQERNERRQREKAEKRRRMEEQRQQKQQAQRREQTRQSQHSRLTTHDDANSQPLSSHHLETSELSSVRQRHVSSSVSERRLEVSVATGDEPSSGAESGPGGRRIGPVEMAGGVRNMIILNTIMAPPRSRQPRRGSR